MAAVANRFGTTSDMIIERIETEGTQLLLAIDDKGLYFTSEERVDKRMADTNRYATDRKHVLQKLEELGYAPAELFEANRHRIPTVTGEAKKKVNPIKASKRGNR